MLKRLFDMGASLLGLIILSPVILCLSLIIRVTSPGPVFYASPRIGLGGRLFKMIKFRSMVQDADKIGARVTAAGDARITPIGRFIRKTKLDELPELWNVLIGDMSFVGPRPENPLIAQLYTPEQQRLLQVRPGVTSLATIKYRNEEDILAGASDLEAAYLKLMQDKLALELEYLPRQSFWLDLAIILRTLAAIAR